MSYTRDIYKMSNVCSHVYNMSCNASYAVFCSVLQCVIFLLVTLYFDLDDKRVAVCCSVLQCVAVCCSGLQCFALCSSVLQCVAVCCSVLRCDIVSFKSFAVCCSVLK